MIQEDDIDSRPLALRPLPWVRRRAELRRRRRIFIALALFVIMALIIDGILVTLVFTHSSHKILRGDAFPLLTLTPDVAYLGQVVQLHLSHFTPLSYVFLSHDVRETLRVDAPSSQIKIGASGNVIVRVLIEGKWGVGDHLIAAEDTHTHYTASVALQVIGSGPVLPPQLQLNTSFLDMGVDWAGANTLRSLTLSNSGGGIISWAVKSNQPWLQLTPAQGVFSDNQTISVAATRIYMKPGNYRGILALISNTGTPAFVQVTMSVRPRPVSSKPGLVVAPPVLAFSVIDGEREPPDQFVTISNPGPTSLPWSSGYSAPTATVNQLVPLQATNWLSASPASGLLAPHASTIIHIQVHSRMLFPSVYTGLLSIIGHQALDTPQFVAVSLSVQQQCGIATDTGAMSFIATAGQQAGASQNVGLHATTGCSSSVPWSAFTLTNWLAVTPANGDTQRQSGDVATVGVDGKLLQSGIFTGLVVFLTEHRTQTITVQLTVLSAPTSTTSTKFPGQSRVSNTSSGGTALSGKTVNGTPVVQGAPQRGSPAPPLLSLSPSQLTFTVSQGQTGSGAQSLTLANAGGRTLTWYATINASATSWLTLATTQGTVSAEQTVALTINTNASNLASGTYKAQIIVNALDGSGSAVAGSPQVLSITLNVVQPCVLQVTPTALSFSSSLLQPDPMDQTITLKVTGNCSLPVSWQANSGSSNWLVVSPFSGSENGTGSSITVHVDTSGKLLGSYNGQITFSAQDSTGASVKISTQGVSVTLDVLG